ncbi:gem-associated protein 7-like isoform X2 [Styela clava]
MSAKSGDDTQEQIDRSFLRERYLKSLLFMTDKKVTFQLSQSTNVEGVFKACDYSLLQFHIEQLRTPSGVHPNALLRTSDVLSCSVVLQ